MEFLFFIFPLLLIFGGHKALVEPFLSGKLEINPYVHPTLYRAQRILRARNTKAREKELAKVQSELDHQTTSAMLAIEAKSKEDLQKARSKHHDEILDWGNQFKAITAAEDAAREAVRQRIYEENRKKEREAERKAAWDKNRSDEARYNAQARAWANQPDPNGGYGTRRIDPNKTLNVREKPNTSSRLWGTLVPGLDISVDGWIYGEPLLYPSTGAYNNIWFRLRDTEPDTLYVWSGGLTNASTYGVRDLNPSINDYKTFLNATLITTDKINAATLTPQGFYVNGQKLADAGGLVAPVSTQYELPPIGMDALNEKLDRIGELTVGELNKLLTKVWEEFDAVDKWAGATPTHRVVEKLNALADAAEMIRAEKSRRMVINPVDDRVMSEAELDRYKQARKKYFQDKNAAEVKLLSKRVDALPKKLNRGEGHEASSLYSTMEPVKGLNFWTGE